MTHLTRAPLLVPYLQCPDIKAEEEVQGFQSQN